METGSKFSITQAFKFSFVTFIEHFPFFLKAGCVALGTYLVIVLSLSSIGVLLFWTHFASFLQLSRALGGIKINQLLVFIFTAGPFFWLVWGLIIFACIAAWRFFALGFTHVSFMFYDHKNPEIADIFSQSHKVLRDTCTFLLFLFLCGLGLIFFVIPGIYLFILFTFFHQSIVYHNTSIIGSFKESKKLIQHNWWKVFAIYILFWLISNAVRMLLWFITLPLASLLYAYIYRKLLEKHVDETIAAA